MRIAAGSEDEHPLRSLLMQGNDGWQSFLAGGFERVGIEADETELAVMAVAESIYRPHIQALLAADLDDVAPEPGIDLSQRPRP